MPQDGACPNAAGPIPDDPSPTRRNSALRPSIAGPTGDRTRRLRVYGTAPVARPPMYSCLRRTMGVRVKTPGPRPREVSCPPPPMPSSMKPCARGGG